MNKLFQVSRSCSIVKFPFWKKINTYIQDKKDQKQELLNIYKEKEQNEVKENEKIQQLVTFDDFYNQIKEMRDEQDKEKQQYKDLIQFYDQRMQRQEEITIKKYDHNDLLKNHKFIGQIQSKEELFDTINTFEKYNKKDIIYIINSFLDFSDDLTFDEIDNLGGFQIFVENVLHYFSLLDHTDIVVVSRFSNLFCIQNELYWEYLERKIVYEVDRFSQEELIEIFSNVSQQNEGSDHFYLHAENFFKKYLKKGTLNISQKASIIKIYHSMKRGTVNFIEKFYKEIIQNIQDLEINQFLEMVKVFSDLQSNKTEASDKENYVINMERFEQIGIEKIQGVDDFYVIMEAGIAFKESNQVFKTLNQKAVLFIKSLNYQQMLLFLEAFLYNYKADEETLQILKVKILKNIDHFDIPTCAKIVKGYYMLGHDDQQLNQTIEAKIFDYLQQDPSLEDIYETVVSYSITRIGQRQFYRLLERVVEVNLEDFAYPENIKMLRNIYRFYMDTGLCKPSLLKQIQNIL